MVTSVSFPPTLTVCSCVRTVRVAVFTTSPTASKLTNVGSPNALDDMIPPLSGAKRDARRSTRLVTLAKVTSPAYVSFFHSATRT